MFLEFSYVLALFRGTSLVLLLCFVPVSIILFVFAHYCEYNLSIFIKIYS